MIMAERGRRKRNRLKDICDVIVIPVIVLCCAMIPAAAASYTYIWNTPVTPDVGGFVALVVTTKLVEAVVAVFTVSVMFEADVLEQEKVEV